MKKYWVALTAVVLVAVSFTACSFKKPAEELPLDAAVRETGLGQEGLPKSFFVDPSGKAKTFMCGAASVGETSELTEDMYGHNMPLWDHCNVEFTITENSLIAKFVSPSFPNDRSRWKTAFAIPIKKHYYYEKEKDSNGRETNKYIENSGRSHWSARPYFKLDLDTMVFGDGNMAYGTSPFGSASVLAVEDIEWDLKNGFLGYTQILNASVHGYDHQMKLRINFKEFTHNEKFVKTPFKDKNYKYMNVLHITGEKVDGVYPILQAAKWDLSRQHEIYLFGFPEAYKPIAKDIVNEWNKTLIKIGAAKSDIFVVKEDKELKYGFDLRYSTMTWIADAKISRAGASPLGVAMVTADVRNGEILWGGITLWGGTIVDYIKGYSSNESISAAPTSALKNLGSFFAKNSTRENLSIPPEIQRTSLMSPAMIVSQNAAMTQQSTTDLINQARKQNKNIKNSDIPVTALQPAELNKIASEAISRSAVLADNYIQSTGTEKYIDKVLKFMRLEKSAIASKDDEKLAPKNLAAQSLENTVRRSNSLIACTERRISDVAMGWKGAMADNKREVNDVLQAVVKELISHEYGHFLGLGHQFKESILPTKGSVPEEIYNSLKAKAEKDQTNMTSVMGYRNPRVEIMTPYDQIVPGPQDELVLRFLYNRQYATYKTGDKDFTFVEVPANGLIPEFNEENKEYKTSYFPQCNDIDASIPRDPFCNRFDRGYNAKTIMTGYIDDLKENLVQTLFAFTEARGGSYESREGYLWFKFLSTMSRMRLFYDYMRYGYVHQFDKIRTNERALYDFSASCQAASIDQVTNPLLKQIFTESPGLKELCQANAMALVEIEKMVSLKASDYTKLNLTNAFSPGGISAGDAVRDYSQWLGSWNELSAMPIKMSSLYTLTTSSPWVLIGGMFDNPHYNNPEFRFSYASLYPTEYTKIIAATTEANLFFSRTGIGQHDYTTMGAAARSLAYFNWLAQNNNDAKKLPTGFLENLRSQSQFGLKLVAIIVETDKEGMSKKRFTGSVYDFYSGTTSPLSEVYILPEGQIIARGQDMFIYPLPGASLRWINETKAYTFAYQVDYSKQVTENDPLAGHSVKTKLQKLNNNLLDVCISGAGETSDKRNGLSSYFNKSNKDFEGFRVDAGIATDDEKQKNFLKSVRLSFEDYWKNRKANPETCAESLRGLGLIVSSSAVLGGMWIPELDVYLDR